MSQTGILYFNVIHKVILLIIKKLTLKMNGYLVIRFNFNCLHIFIYLFINEIELRTDTQAFRTDTDTQ